MHPDSHRLSFGESLAILAQSHLNRRRLIAGLRRPLSQESIDQVAEYAWSGGCAALQTEGRTVLGLLLDAAPHQLVVGGLTLKRARRVQAAAAVVLGLGGIEVRDVA